MPDHFEGHIGANIAGGYERDPVRAMENVLDAAREYVRFVVFKPDRPAAHARERLQAAIAAYDAIIAADGGGA